MTCQVSIFNYSIKNNSDDSVDIYIDGDIVDAGTQSIYKEFWGDDTTTSFKSFRDELNKRDVSTYNVYINSGGGLVTDAMAIHDLLKSIQQKGKTVNTVGRGIIASAATYILMAGNKPIMSKNSWLMIHNVSGAVWGDVNLVESYATTLRKFNDSTRDFYADATGIRKEDITKMMNAETWMTADEAKEKGFIKNIEGEAAFTNKIPKEHWQFSNMAVLNAYNACVTPPQQNTQSQNLEDMKKFFEELGEKILNAVKGVKAPENNDHSILMQSIGEAVSNSFKEAAESMELSIKNTVDEAVKEAVKTEELTEEEKQADAEGKKTAEEAAATEKKESEELKETVQNLNKKVADMETEIKNSIGTRTSQQENNAGGKVIGTFHKD